MSLKSLVRREAASFRNGVAAVYDRRMAWEPFVEMASRVLEEACTQAREQKLFESMYTDNSLNKKVEFNYVNIFFGQHPIGMKFQSNMGSLVLEGGCTLQYSQAPQGGVVCMFYPFASSQIIPLRKYYIYTIYKSPTCIKQRNIIHHLSILFAIAQYSSCFGHSGFINRFNRLELYLNMYWNKLLSRDPIETALVFLGKVAKKTVDAAISKSAGGA